MNQRELVRIVSNRTGESRKRIHEVIECLADVISERVLDDDKVTITKLGIFKKKSISSRMGYDPYNAKRIFIPEALKVSFESSKHLKEKISQK